MTAKQREEFLNKTCEDNTTWVAQMILMVEAKERRQMIWALRKLDKVLYKSWAKDMSLRDIIEAINMISTERPQQTGAFAE